jgi:hypothetical protein
MRGKRQHEPTIRRRHVSVGLDLAAPFEHAGRTDLRDQDLALLNLEHRTHLGGIITRLCPAEEGASLVLNPDELFP